MFLQLRQLQKFGVLASLNQTSPLEVKLVTIVTLIDRSQNMGCNTGLALIVSNIHKHSESTHNLTEQILYMQYTHQEFRATALSACSGD
jgi:hypothetical protein